MLSNEFFTRKDLADIIEHDDGNFRRFEKKGLMSPKIKPSKFDYNQVIFAYICKELTKFTKLSWANIIDRLSAKKLDLKPLNTYKLMVLVHFDNTNETDVFLINDDELDKQLDLFVKMFKQAVAVDVEDLTVFQYNTRNDLGMIEVTMISIDKIIQKVEEKCNKLSINFNQKNIA